MEDQIAISRIKQGDLKGLEILVDRYQATPDGTPFQPRSHRDTEQKKDKLRDSVSLWQKDLFGLEVISTSMTP